MADIVVEKWEGAQSIFLCWPVAVIPTSCIQCETNIGNQSDQAESFSCTYAIAHLLHLIKCERARDKLNGYLY